MSLSSLWKTSEQRLTWALLLLMLALYIPFAGNYGLWDPWETHYSEVARQMVMRHDYVSLWWPGSPQDRNEFWSKPVLTFWLMVFGFLTTGLERPDHKFDGEMAVGWTAEWSVRIPFILCAIACLWAVWELTRRLAGRRAAFWSVVVLATASQFFYVARQAMTDMAFVAPIAGSSTSPASASPTPPASSDGRTRTSTSTAAPARPARRSASARPPSSRCSRCAPPMRDRAHGKTARAPLQWRELADAARGG